MSTYSRREILFGAFGSQSEDKRNSIPTKTGQRKVVAGKLRDFPVGSKILLPRWGVYLESFPEGLRAVSETEANQCYTVQINAQGEVEVDFEKSCASDTAFSVLTNEPIRFN